MYKFLLISLLVICGSKVELTEVEIQKDLPGIASAPVSVNYKATLFNPKEKEVQIAGVWLEGVWYTDFNVFKSSESKIVFSTTLIQRTNEDNYAFKDEKGNRSKIKIVVKGKEEILAIKNVNELESIARP